MKFSAQFVTLAFVALSSLVTALPTARPDSFTSLEELAARSSLECMYTSTGNGHCDTQGCRDGGGYCRYNAQTKRCHMENMRGKGAPFGCQFCGCKVA
ncbi:hypothetical protein CPB84DRAFT_1792456 [Gymnopilus junonius]|uniref:Uncharacterized protein n=1 Tax=Gymnopilus junonius TaxID=109634 RepID=A0A9P5NB36_GYMJU|nr:hypothetical protein CPB84DRAFT_1798536 [Gymnopilus junonius]KAF8880594.1 hypothetical protein CPB84DRAFT_1792456 [Gymnopilus junonius]